MLPMVAGGGGTGRRIVGVLFMVGLIALVIRDPVGAAQTVQQLARWGSDFLDALSAFGAALSEEPTP
jgi:hypothetical protein